LPADKKTMQRSDRSMHLSHRNDLSLSLVCFSNWD